jgi:hypothetical protein
LDLLAWIVVLTIGRVVIMSPGWIHNWMNPHRHRHNEWKKTGPQKRTKQTAETWICENEACKLLMGGCGCGCGCGCTLVHATAQSERLILISHSPFT